jgi:hypothetical protein
MEIYLPESGTGGNEKDWQPHTHIFSATQKQQINTLVEYQAILSKKLKEIDEKVVELYLLKEDILNSKKDAESTLKKTKNTEALVIFGFFALLLVVIGIGYGYWQFVFDSSKNDDYRYGLSDKIKDQSNEFKDLKECLKLGGWNKCF